MKEVSKTTTTKTTKAKETKKPIKSILISQPRPEGDRSPYFDLEKKYGVQLNFHPFLMPEIFAGKKWIFLNTLQLFLLVDMR